MRWWIRYWLVLIGALLFLPWHPARGQEAGDVTVLRFPLQFTENAGQWPSELLYAALRPQQAAWLTKEGLTFRFASPEAADDARIPVEAPAAQDRGWCSMRFVQPSPRLRVDTREQTSTVSHFYMGNDSSAWRHDVGNYREILYRDVWKNIDVSYMEHNGALSQEITLHPGADASDLRFRIEGLPRGAMPRACLVSIKTEEKTETPLAYHLDAGEMSFPTLSDMGRMPMTVRIDFVERFGGSRSDEVYGFAIDDNGSMYIAGVTSSWDLPVRNAYMQSYQGVGDYFLAGFECDGTTIAFCTYLGGSHTECPPTLYATAHSSTLRITALGKLLLFGETRSRDFPIIGDVVQPMFVINEQIALDEKVNGCIVLLSNRGIPENSTFVGGPGRTYLSDNAVDGSGNIYILGGVAYDSLWCITPSVISPRLNSKYRGSTALVKLKPDLSDVVYATYITGVGGENTQHPDAGRSFLGVDSRQNVYVVGKWQGGDTSAFPVVNEKYSFTPEIRNYPKFIMKLDSQAANYIYSTWFSDTGYDAEFRQVMLDSNDNLYMTGTSRGTESIVTSSFISGSVARTCASITKLDSSGTVIFHNIFGAQYEWAEASLIDRCGHIVVLGTGTPESSPEPLVGGTRTGQIGTTSFRDVLYAFDQSGRDIIYSSDYDYLTSTLGASAYFNLGRGAPVYDNAGNYYKYSWSINPAGDALCVRFHPPVCEPLSCTMSCIDSVVIAKRRRYVTPPSFRIEVELGCSDTHGAVNMLGGVLTLPANLVLTPDTQSLVLPAMSFAPGQQRRYVWTVRLDTTRPLESWDTVAFSASYALQKQASSCPVSATVCRRQITIVEADEGDPDLHCTLSLPDTLRCSADGLSYDGNPLDLYYWLENRESDSVVIDNVRLILPVGMSITAVPAGDLMRVGGVLAPGANLHQRWVLRAASIGNARIVDIIVHAFDNYGILVSRCVRTVLLDAITGIACDLTGPARARYYPSTGRLDPDSCAVTAVLENPLDTLAGLASVRLDFAKAKRLALADIEVNEKGPSWITTRFRKAFVWKLKALSPLESGMDTVTVRYTTVNGEKEGSCEYALPVDVLQHALDCTFAGPDSLSQRDSACAPNPFQVVCMIVNGGQATSPPLWAELTCANASVHCLDVALVALPEIAAGDSVRRTWNLAARSSRFDRSAALMVAVRDSSGAVLNGCGKLVYLPGVEHDLRCAMVFPDTLHYDVSTDTYAPDPFTALLALANVLDTAQAVIEAEIDLSAAPHLAPDAGETAGKTFDSIPAHDLASLAWRLAVAKRSDSAITEPITVRYRHAGDSAASSGSGGGSGSDSAWLTCTKDIVIEGGKRIIAASCRAAGHDTLWADVAYEDVIPHPVQVQYTIANTGTVPLASCTAAIVHPPQLLLVNPSDSIQQYGMIAPGASVAREWLLLLDQSQGQAGDMQLSWVRGCSDLVSDSVCTHRVTLVTGPPRGIVLSPWLLRFRAEQHAALPTPQTVTLWPGGALAMPWQLQPSASWLDLRPLSGSTKQAVAVQPNTTDLQDGVYPSGIDVASSAMVTPPRVDVIYEIATLNAMPGPPTAPNGVNLESPYPNPTRSAVTVAFTIASTGAVQFALYDIYGRRVAILAEGPYAPGRHAVRTDLSTLPAGVYVCVLNVGGSCAARRLVLRK